MCITLKYIFISTSTLSMKKFHSFIVVGTIEFPLNSLYTQNYYGVYFVMVLSYTNTFRTNSNLKVLANIKRNAHNHWHHKYNFLLSLF